MKKVLYITTALTLAACAQPEPIADYDAPYAGKGAPVAAPAPARAVEEFVECPFKPGQFAKVGHVEALCFEDEDGTTTVVIIEEPPVIDDDDDDDKPGKPGGQNPGNDKPVGGSPFDGEQGEEPSGKPKKGKKK